MDKVESNQQSFQGLRWIQYLTLLVVLVNLVFGANFFLNDSKKNRVLVPETSVINADKIDDTQEKTTPALGIEIVTLIESLRPKTAIKIKKEVEREQDVLYIGFWVENIGNHELTTSINTLKLSASPFEGENDIEANVKVLYVNPSSVILPGEKQEQQFRIDLSGYEKKTIFYSLQMKSIPNPTIEKIVRKLASGFEIQIPDAFFILNSTRVGAISL